MEMDPIKRLDAVEFVAEGLVTDGHVLEMLMRALIANHPHSEAVKATFQLLLSASESLLPDGGFSVGAPTEEIRQMQKRIDREAQRWLGFFPKPASSAGTDPED